MALTSFTQCKLDMALTSFTQCKLDMVLTSFTQCKLAIALERKACAIGVGSSLSALFRQQRANQTSWQDKRGIDTTEMLNTILRNSGYLSSIKQHPMYMQRIIEVLHNYRYTQFINSQFIETIGERVNFLAISYKRIGTTHLPMYKNIT